MSTALDLPSPETKSTRLQSCLLAALLALLCLGAFANNYWGAIVYDDGLCLVHRDALNEWWPDKLSTGRRRWLTHLTFVANHKLHGYWLPGYHLVNNLIHLAAGLCLFGLVRRTLLLPPTRERYARSAPWLALAIAALWMVHPLQTESVTYIVQRLESLAGMLFLLSLYLVLRGSQSARPAGWYLLATVVVWLGTGSKEIMYLAPIAVLGFDRAYLAGSWREVFSRRWPLYVGILPALVWSAYWLKNSFRPDIQADMGFGYKGITPWEYLRTQPEVILHYLWLSFWPAEQCIDYGWRVEHDPWRIYGCGAIMVALVMTSLVLLWRRPRLGFVAFMFFFVLAPTSSFLPIRDLAFEHRMYLPLVSVVILVVLGLHGLCRRVLRLSVLRIAIPASICMVAVVVLTERTLQRNRLYHDPVNVWREVVQRSPWHARGAYNLGQLLVFRGMIPPGQYETLLLTDPKTLERLGNADRPTSLKGDLAEAVTWLGTAIELDPKDYSAHFNLGGLYDRAGRHGEAIYHYQRTLDLKPKHLNARMNLARTLAEQGDVAGATLHFKEAIAQAPKDARPHVGLGKLFAHQGEHAQAIEQFRKALEVKPEQVSPRYQLARSLWAMGKEADAINALREVRLVHRSLYDVNLELARYLAQTSVAELHNPAEGAAIARPLIDDPGAPTAEACEALALCQAELAQYDQAALTIDRGLAAATRTRDTARIQALQDLRERVQASISVAND
jgi:Flp pilus assembly protein TadD